jgi:hypothetical protein
MWLWLIVLVAFRPATAAVDANEMIRRSMTVMESNWKAARAYAFTKREQDADGVKTYRVSMMLGTPYKELVMENGRRLSAEEQVKEREKRDRALERRRAESPDERQARLKEFHDDRDRDHRIFVELPNAFTYVLAGRRRDGDRDIDVLSGHVRRDYDPPTMEARVLKAMAIEIWIDPESLQWTRVVASVTASVPIAGFLASVDRGTRFELQQGPVGDGVWLPKRFEQRTRGSLLFMFHHRSDEVDTFFDYRRESES